MLSLNGTQVTPTIFPDKTSQVWKLPFGLLQYSHAVIEWKFENEAEFIHLAQLKDLLDQYKIIVDLHLPYLPYGRQDKFVSNDATFALITFAHLLNVLKFNRIDIIDPHSNKALAFIANSFATYPESEVLKTIERVNADLVCYPDHGALYKYSEVYDLKIETIHGSKVRDQATGNIISCELIGSNPFGKNVLIVDDLADGGMTFKILAKDLLAAGANEVHLFVTHGIFSKGLRTLHESGIKRIFTRDGEKSEI